MQQTKSSNTTTIGDLVALKKQEQQNQLTPYMMFKYSIRSELTRKYYERRLRRFFDFIQRRTGVERSKFDSAEHDILNLQNGLLNSETGEFTEHSPTHLSLVQLPIRYDPNAKCPNISKFLEQVLHPQDVSTALQIFGYCLYKSAKYEKAIMLFGTGSNG